MIYPTCIVFLGCKDAQTSADLGNSAAYFAVPGGPAELGGALTDALLEVLYHKIIKYQLKRFSSFKSSNKFERIYPMSV